MPKISEKPTIYVPILLSRSECRDILDLSDRLEDLERVRNYDTAVVQLKPFHMWILRDIVKQINDHSEFLNL